MKTTLKEMNENLKRLKDFDPEGYESALSFSTVFTFMPKNEHELYVRQETTKEQNKKVFEMIDALNRLSKTYLTYKDYMNKMCSAINSEFKEDKEVNELCDKYTDYLKSAKLEMIETITNL